MGTNLVSELQAAGVPLHAALKAAASAANVRQFAIANRVGVSEGQLAKLLAGRRLLSPEMAAKIEAAITELAA